MTNFFFKLKKKPSFDPLPQFLWQIKFFQKNSAFLRVSSTMLKFRKKMIQFPENPQRDGRMEGRRDPIL